MPAKARTRRVRQQGPRLTLPDAGLIRIGELHRLLGVTLGSGPAGAGIFARLSDGALPIIGRKITFADANAALDNDVSRVTRIEDVGMPADALRKHGIKWETISKDDFSILVESRVLVPGASGLQLQIEPRARVWPFVRRADTAALWPDLLPEIEAAEVQETRQRRNRRSPVIEAFQTRLRDKWGTTNRVEIAAKLNWTGDGIVAKIAHELGIENSQLSSLGRALD
jgi:hypothetical protein